MQLREGTACREHGSFTFIQPAAQRMTCCSDLTRRPLLALQVRQLQQERLWLEQQVMPDPELPAVSNFIPQPCTPQGQGPPVFVTRPPLRHLSI